MRDGTMVNFPISTSLSARRSMDRMDTELRCLLAISRFLPPVKGMWRISDRLRNLYCRKPRQPSTVSVHGSVMTLDPANWLEGLYLFSPQIMDRACLRFIRRVVGEGAVFVDCGSYVGYYSLFASKLVGEAGRVIAIEAAPDTYERLTRNIRLNGAEGRIEAHNLGISDERETLKLGREESALDGGHSFLFPERADSVEVECLPFDTFVAETGLAKIDFLKLDVEGLEYRILRRFFGRADRSLLPRYIQVEQLGHEDWIEKAGGNALDLLREAGYSGRLVSNRNFILERR